MLNGKEELPTPKRSAYIESYVERYVWSSDGSLSPDEVLMALPAIPNCSMTLL
jgi:hypothetical protein